MNEKVGFLNFLYGTNSKHKTTKNINDFFTAKSAITDKYNFRVFFNKFTTSSFGIRRQVLEGAGNVYFDFLSTATDRSTSSESSPWDT